MAALGNHKGCPYSAQNLAKLERELTVWKRKGGALAPPLITKAKQGALAPEAIWFQGRKALPTLGSSVAGLKPRPSEGHLKLSLSNQALHSPLGAATGLDCGNARPAERAVGRVVVLNG